MNAHKKIVLAQRPKGSPRPNDFSLEECPIPEPADGQFLVRIIYCSLDPATRRWMDEDSYGVPISIGGGITCLVVGQVEESRCVGYERGDYVTGMGSVASYTVMQPGLFTRKIFPSEGLPATSYLNALGAIGLTAYNGLVIVGKPGAGETVLVSGAAGAVGSIVGQIAKIKGCHVVGIAGGEEKCRLLVDYYGFDDAVDYKGKSVSELTKEIGKACSNGVDIFFDNVGGDILDATLATINQHARIIECGMISQYNEVEPPPGPRNIWQVVAKTATMYGFLNRYYSDYFEEAFLNLEKWFTEGNLKTREHVDEGLENFYSSFMRLFDGSNKGKLILKVSKED